MDGSKNAEIFETISSSHSLLLSPHLLLSGIQCRYGGRLTTVVFGRPPTPFHSSLPPLPSPLPIMQGDEVKICRIVSFSATISRTCSELKISKIDISRGNGKSFDWLLGLLHSREG